jgi:hypothetical protein
MTDTNPRDLIRRLTTKLDLLQCQINVPYQSALIDEALAYLDQSEPEGFTDEPLGDLIDKWVQEAFRKKPYGCKHPTHSYVACKAFKHGRNHAARAYLAQPKPEGPTDEELNAMLYYEFTTSTGHGERSDPVGFARAVLARWGK